MPKHRKPHRWRDYVTGVYHLAAETWNLQCEAVAIGYETETREYAEQNPRPTFKEALVGNAGLGPWS